MTASEITSDGRARLLADGGRLPMLGLGVDRLDLYLIHWPQRGPTWAWPGMERARERGLTRSIGVSNFSAAELDQVAAAGSVVPAVPQDMAELDALDQTAGTARALERGWW
jgi:diketogulonate reductase-like aldo/keto reductase